MKTKQYRRLLAKAAQERDAVCAIAHEQYNETVAAIERVCHLSGNKETRDGRLALRIRAIIDETRQPFELGDIMHALEQEGGRPSIPASVCCCLSREVKYGTIVVVEKGAGQRATVYKTVPREDGT